MSILQKEVIMKLENQSRNISRSMSNEFLDGLKKLVNTSGKAWILKNLFKVCFPTNLHALQELIKKKKNNKDT